MCLCIYINIFSLYFAIFLNVAHVTKMSFVSSKIYVPVIALPDLCARRDSETACDYHADALRRIRTPESSADFYSIDDIGAMKSL